MANTIRLEDFRGGSVLPKADDSKEKEAHRNRYQAGFDDGFAAAEHLLMLEQAKLTAALLEEVQDAQLKQHAAREAVIRDIAPTIAEMVRAIAPHLASETLIAATQARVAELLKVDEEVALSITAPNAHVSALKEALQGAAEVRAAKDPAQTDIRVHWSHGFDRIAPDLAADAVIATISAFFNLQKEDADEHDKRHSA
ncbi:hypothetical protein ACMA5I_00850 [Paracoccaceae bacterium GXU_MW_L88]